MPERAQAALDLLVADVIRFQGLVEDLLEISRFDAGAIRLNLEDLLVAEFVAPTLARHATTGESWGVALWRVSRSNPRRFVRQTGVCRYRSLNRS